MPTDKERRKSVRLAKYDYSQKGAYFVTICTQQQKSFFDRQQLANVAQSAWRELPERFPTVELDAFVVMPNHIHFVLWLNPPEENRRGAINCAPTDSTSPIGERFKVDKHRPTLGQVIRAYKAMVTRRIRRKGENEFTWQRNYFEHIIRSEQTLNAIRQYIEENPMRWDIDRYNPNVRDSNPQSKALWNLIQSDHQNAMYGENEIRNRSNNEGREWGRKYDQR